MHSQGNLLSIAVWAIFLGIVFSMIYITLQKSSINRFIFSLIDKKAFTPESGKSLLELGISSSINRSIICSVIKTQHGLIRIIGFCYADKHKLPGEFSKLVPTDECTFYIDESAVNEATEKYAVKKSNKAYLAICIALLFIISCLATTVITWLSSYAGNVFSNHNSSHLDSKENINETPIEYEQTNEENAEDNSSVNDSSEQEDTFDKDNDSVLNEDNDTAQAENNISRPTIPKGPMG